MPNRSKNNFETTCCIHVRHARRQHVFLVVDRECIFQGRYASREAGTLIRFFLIRRTVRNNSRQPLNAVKSLDDNADLAARNSRDYFRPLEPRCTFASFASRLPLPPPPLPSSPLSRPRARRVSLLPIVLFLLLREMRLNSVYATRRSSSLPDFHEAFTRESRNNAADSFS